MAGAGARGGGMTDSRVEVVGLRHRYGEQLVLDGIGFAVAGGELLAIVGPSGSGKTTLLRSVAGLLAPSEGEVRVAGATVRGVPDGMAIVFQDYARSLFPWMSVRANVELPLRHAGFPRDERRRRAAEALAEVGLEAVGDRYPTELSGGMQQRAAIARALAIRPSILLMDEPFGSVDAQTRAGLQDLLLDIWAFHDMTILFVTHDIDEAVYLADRVLVLSKAPARLAATIGVDIPRPRDQVESRASASFAEARTRVARLIRRAEDEAAIPEP